MVFRENGEINLADFEITPVLAGLAFHVLAPARHVLGFGIGVGEFAPLGFQDPADQPLFGLLDGHEVGVVETNAAFFVKILDTKPRVPAGWLWTNSTDDARLRNATSTTCRG